MNPYQLSESGFLHHLEQAKLLREKFDKFRLHIEVYAQDSIKARKDKDTLINMLDEISCDFDALIEVSVCFYETNNQ